MSIKGQGGIEESFSLIIFVVILLAIITAATVYIGVSAWTALKTGGKLSAVDSTHIIKNCLLENDDMPTLWGEAEEKLESCKVSDVFIKIRDMETGKKISKEMPTGIGGRKTYKHYIWLPVRTLEGSREEIHTARMEVIKYVKE